LFRFVQLEFPWVLGPADGRYLIRSQDRPDAPPSHVLVLATLGAPRRRRLERRRRAAAPRPEPAPVPTSRATVIELEAPFADSGDAAAWLRRAGIPELDAALNVLNRLLHAFRVASADPLLAPVGRRAALAARVGYGAGEQVAEGLWLEALELVQRSPRGSRKRMLTPQARFAAVLAGRQPPLACEELALRARLDLDHGRLREAALQLQVALDAALAELPQDAGGTELQERVDELAARQREIAKAARAALAGPLGDTQREALERVLGRLEAALRARGAQLG
jgi:hypothetical protein